MSSRLFYHGTDEEMRLGDRILIHRWLRSDQIGTVTYIPGLSPRDAGLGDDQWAFQTEDGTVYATGYAPNEPGGQLGKGIRLVCHAGAEAEAAIKSLEIPADDDSPETLTDFFAFLGCGVIVLIVIGAIIHLVMWLFS